MIRWFISIIRVGDSGLKYWCIIEYTELDHRKKVIHIKLSSSNRWRIYRRVRKSQCNHQMNKEAVTEDRGVTGGECQMEKVPQS